MFAALPSGAERPEERSCRLIFTRFRVYGEADE
jgi:hypothetical protein